MVQSFSLKIKILSILLLCLFWQTDAQANRTFSCEKDIYGFPYKLENISGIWYEAARMPPSEVPACVRVTVPHAIEGENLNLQLNYISNVNKKWRPTQENIQFPWNRNTQRGIFEIQYDSVAVNISFTFKLIATDYKTVALICYYTNYVPTLTMLKIMTREQQLDQKSINSLQNLADLQGLGDQITWVEQSSRCNGSQTVLPSTSLLWLLSFWILSKKLCV